MSGLVGVLCNVFTTKLQDLVGARYRLLATILLFIYSYLLNLMFKRKKKNKRLGTGRDYVTDDTHNEYNRGVT